MNIQKVSLNGKDIAVLSSDELLISDVRSALDLIMTAKYEAGTNLLAVDKNAITEDFFILNRGLAGEVLQKFINYHAKIAVFGDYSKYNSKPLKDFMYESNKGNDVFFVATQEEAITCLARTH